MPPLSDSLSTAKLALVLITFVPVMIVWLLGLFSSRPEKPGVIRVGSPLKHDAEVFDHDTVHECVLHLSRTETAADLRGLALGLRNAPVEEAAPLLKHFMQSADPELALFSQSILQQGREQLQTTLNQLQNHHEQTDPRIAAGFLETSLRIVAPSLAAPDERESRIRQIAKRAGEALASCAHTPRLLAACVRVFLVAGDPQRARSILDAMPADAPLRRELEPRVHFALVIKQRAEAS